MELAFQNTKNVIYTSKSVYHYITDRSVQYSGLITDEKAKHLLVGSNQIEYLASFIPDAKFFKNQAYLRITELENILNKSDIY